MSRIIKLGYIQQANSACISKNRENLVAKIKRLANDGAQLVVLQELHASLYFCQTESVDNFDLAIDINGEETGVYSNVAKECGIVLVTSLFERRGYITTPPLFLKKTDLLPGNIARCIFLTIRHIMRNSTLRPGI